MRKSLPSTAEKASEPDPYLGSRLLYGGRRLFHRHKPSEFLEDRKVCGQVIQIFGTDLNECNISRAQQGVYTKNIEAHV